MNTFHRKNLGSEFTTYVELETGEVEIIVEYDFFPGQNATHWEPPMEPELSINGIILKESGDEFTPTPEQALQIERAAWDHIEGLD